MGGVGGFLFGKPSKQKSESGNKAYGDIKNAFGPAMNYTVRGGDAMGSLLGLGGGGGGGGRGKNGTSSSLASGGTGGQTDALENFSNSGGMQFLREQGNKQITSNKAAAGLLKSGSFGTALTKYGQGLGSTYLNQYMEHLLNYSKLGLGAGGLVGSAGAYSKGSGSGAKEGALPMIAQAAGAFASDPRLKTNIVKVGTLDDGLDVYDFDYIAVAPSWVPQGRFRGVMADEVALLRPDALGPLRDGFMTVSEELRPVKIGN